LARSARTSNGVTLDYADATEFRRQHYAFLVSEPEFDAALSRIKRAGIAFYADFSRAVALTGPRVADILETSAAEPASEPRYPEKYLVRRGI
jgi:hypothetical protein